MKKPLTAGPAIPETGSGSRAAAGQPAVSRPGATAFRTDIQALRGMAVLLVLFDHAQVGPWHAGYLGVDIFFVISGYLITGMVRDGIAGGTFSFVEFYFRRAKRLLPAAYVTFLATALVSLFMLTAAELRDFLKQLLGAVTFSANMFLWRQAGYFDGPAQFKPLLHIWSLSIEEQYYMLLPASMAFLRQRWWFAGALLVLAGSLVLCFGLQAYNPSAAFYMLPARAWELAVGSVGALIAADGERLKAVLARLFLPALALLLLIPVQPIGAAHPGVDALLVCGATLVVILRRHAVLNQGGAPLGLAKVGDFSYSLYLAHWPLFAFLNNVYVDVPPAPVRGGALLLALALGYLLYRYVESPCRRLPLRFSLRAVGAGLAASLGLVLLPVGAVLAQGGDQSYLRARRANLGFGEGCDYGGNFVLKKECSSPGTPTVLVWGDSFAMHLVPGISATTQAGVVQATRSVCGPFLGLAPMDNTYYDRNWARQCLQFNRSVLDYLAATPSIKVVVLSSPFGQYVNPAFKRRVWKSLVENDGRLVEETPSSALATRAMQATVARLRALGKRVIVVAPPPASGFDIGKCLERRATGKLFLGGGDRCDIPLADFQRWQQPTLGFLKGLPAAAGVEVVDFQGLLCSSRACASELNGTFLYRDDGHFSWDGSILVARRMNLGEMLQRAAK